MRYLARKISLLNWCGRRPEKTTPSSSLLGMSTFLFTRNHCRISRDLKTVWRESKLGAKQIMAQYEELRVSIGNDDEAVQTALRE